MVVQIRSGAPNQESYLYKSCKQINYKPSKKEKIMSEDCKLNIAMNLHTEAMNKAEEYFINSKKHGIVEKTINFANEALELELKAIESLKAYENSIDHLSTLSILYVSAIYLAIDARNIEIGKKLLEEAKNLKNTYDTFEEDLKEAEESIKIHFEKE